jgi:uncharacterized protein YecE (DUF72 family)
MDGFELISEPENTAVQWEPMPFPPDLGKHRYLFGTSGYHFDDWIGTFNPPRGYKGEFGNQDRLQFYQRYFPFVEINNTFYREQDQGYFESLCKRTESLTYSVKVNREISHTRTWKAEEGEQIMLRNVQAVQPISEAGKFYSFLIQLGDFVRYDKRKLDYLTSVSEVALGASLDVHIEFRHISWHTVDTLQTLKDQGIGICNTDIPRIKDAFPLKSYATNSKGYIRYSGRNLENWYQKGPRDTSKQRTESRNARYDYEYTITELEDFALGQIALTQKTDLVAVAYNNHYSGQAVRNAIQNMQILNAKLTEQVS